MNYHAAIYVISVDVSRGFARAEKRLFAGMFN